MLLFTGVGGTNKRQSSQKVLLSKCVCLDFLALCIGYPLCATVPPGRGGFRLAESAMGEGGISLQVTSSYGSCYDAMLLYSLMVQ